MRVQAIIATQRFEINSPDRFAPIVTTQKITDQYRIVIGYEFGNNSNRGETSLRFDAAANPPMFVLLQTERAPPRLYLDNSPTVRPSLAQHYIRH